MLKVPIEVKTGKRKVLSFKLNLKLISLCKETLNLPMLDLGSVL